MGIATQISQKAQSFDFQVTPRLILQCAVAACAIAIVVAQVFQARNNNLINDKSEHLRANGTGELENQIRQLEQRGNKYRVIKIVSLIAAPLLGSFLAIEHVKLAFVSLILGSWAICEAVSIKRNVTKIRY